ncbi:MAG: M48 family metallopeptidase [bacterium]|nr:M48 family metallopeptidase [bacterium]
MINKMIVIALTSIFILQPSAAKSQTNDASPPVSQSSSQKTGSKKYPGKHPDFEEIGNRKLEEKGVDFYSMEKEIALGKMIAQDIEKSARMIEDPVISEYVNRIGQNLVRNSDAVVPFTIKVLDMEEINAFALPGGFFFVNSGLILTVDDEAELAGVMAHEIAHVAARHGTRQATKGRIANIAMIPLIFMGGWTGYGIRQAAGMAIPMTFLKFSRAYEEEADELGLQYLWKAGYDPTAMPSIFEKLSAMEKRKQGTLSRVFSSHPPNSSRVKKTQNIIEFLTAKTEYVSSSSEFIDIKSRLGSLVGYKKSKPDQGKPTLRKKDAGVINSDETPESPEDDKTEEDDRPVLKRR